jgi:hypothetical protein
MSFPEWSPLDESGGRRAQVLDPWCPWVASFGDLAATMRSAWSAKTAWIDDWDRWNPARGQCGTSALVLQDECGGDVLRGLVHETGCSATPTVHYWNVVGDRHVDLTWQQFSAWAFVLRGEPVHRDALLVNEWFITSYARLRDRFDARLDHSRDASRGHSEENCSASAAPHSSNVPGSGPVGAIGVTSSNEY